LDEPARTPSAGSKPVTVTATLAGLAAMQAIPGASEASMRLLKWSPAPPYSTSLAAWMIDRHASFADHSVAALPPKQALQVIARWRRALCLTNDERDDLAGVIEGFGVLSTKWPELSVAGQKRVAARRWFKESMRLVAVRDPQAAKAIIEQVAELADTKPGI